MVSRDRTPDGRLGEVLSNIQMPLENLAWTIEEYLLANGPRLDSETRFLLAGARDCADRVAGSVRKAAGRNHSWRPPDRSQNTGPDGVSA